MVQTAVIEADLQRLCYTGGRQECSNYVAQASLRHRNDVGIPRHSAAVERLQQIRNRTESRHGSPARTRTVLKSSVRDRADERAAPIDGKSRHVREKPLPRIVLLKQILLDVGRVERGHRRAVSFRYPPTDRIAFGPAKSPTSGTMTFLLSRSFRIRKFSSVAR